MIDDLLKATAQAFGLSVQALTGKNRHSHVVWARQAAMWVLRERVPGISLVAIGQSMGGRDYTTVIYALRQVPLRRAEDPHYDQLISQLGA